MKSARHTVIFWIVALGVGIITLALCVYPYLWLGQKSYEMHQDET